MATDADIRAVLAEVRTLLADVRAMTLGPGVGRFEDGTEAAPGVRFREDLDTGLYRKSPDRLALVTGGADRLIANPDSVEVAGPLYAQLVNLQRQNQAAAAPGLYPDGIYSSSHTDSAGWPETLMTMIGVRDGNSRHAQIAFKKDTGKTYVRAGINADSWGPWRKLFSGADIVGTIQRDAAGNHTGGIIENGSNANGEYVLFANGFALAQSRRLIRANSTEPQFYPFPIAFSSTRTAASISGNAASTSDPAGGTNFNNRFRAYTATVVSTDVTGAGGWKVRCRPDFFGYDATSVSDFGAVLFASGFVA